MRTNLHHPCPARNRSQAAFTIIELFVVIALAVLSLLIALPFLTPRHTCCGRTPKDATQIRNTVQAMITFANSNGEVYPLPSRLDAENFTVVPGDDQSKDNTGNILSILVYNGSVSTEMCISPAESNTTQVVKDDKYEYENPAAAATPAKALWDPGFAGTPIDPLPRRNASGDLSAQAPVAHQSYAHAPPVGGRLKLWANSFNTTEAIFGNRGPEYSDTVTPASGRYTLAPGATGTFSNTLLIHGGKNTWEGNIGYNDGHVAFETKPHPDGVTYLRAGATKPQPASDNLFVDETDEIDAKGQPRSASERTNNFLRPVANLPASGGPLKQGTTPGSHLWID